MTHFERARAVYWYLSVFGPLNVNRLAALIGEPRGTVLAICNGAHLHGYYICEDDKGRLMPAGIGRSRI